MPPALPSDDIEGNGKLPGQRRKANGLGMKFGYRGMGPDEERIPLSLLVRRLGCNNSPPPFISGDPFQPGNFLLFPIVVSNFCFQVGGGKRRGGFVLLCTSKHRSKKVNSQTELTVSMEKTASSQPVMQ